MKEIYIAEKDEIYTYDEFSIIKEKAPVEIHEKIELLQKAVMSDKSRKVVFFMPKATFNIMSLFQGDNSICKIEENDIKLMSDGQIDGALLKKLKLLLHYLQEGNSVVPVVIEADELKKVTLE